VKFRHLIIVITAHILAVFLSLFFYWDTEKTVHLVLFIIVSVSCLLVLLLFMLLTISRKISGNSSRKNQSNDDSNL